MSHGKLYLLPVPLGANLPCEVLPAPVLSQAQQLSYFVAENAKSARAFLKALPCTRPIQEIHISELNAHTPAAALPKLLDPLRAGHDIGLISEAGCPAVADPGSALVTLAHKEGFILMPLIGPSSILLALMGSGLSGQNFAFHGYLPVKDDIRQKKLKALEKDSRSEKRTHIFIETPYRNRALFGALLSACAPSTRLCLASNLSLPNQAIHTHSCAAWQKKGCPDMDKQPTVFLLQA